MKQSLLFIMLIIVFSTVCLFAQQKELEEKRTFNSKTFLNEDNSYTTRVSAGYVHYLDEDGKFKEINRNIVPSASEYDFEVADGLYQAFFKSDLSQPNAVACQTRGGAGINTQLVGIGYLDNSPKDYVTIQQVQQTSALTKENEIYYPNVFKNVDMRLVYSDVKLKEEILLTQQARNNLPRPENYKMKYNQTYIVFIHKLDMNMPSVQPFVNNSSIKSKSFEGDDRIEFRDIKGNVKFYLPLDYAFMEAERDSIFSENITIVKKWIIDSDGQQYLLAGVPLSWVDSRPAGTIVFDPSVVIHPGAEYGKDTMINNATAENCYKNFGTNSSIYLGSSSNWRTLIQFDVSFIDATADILSAELSLKCYQLSASGPVNAYPLTHKWLEGSASSAVNTSVYNGATWNERWWGNNTFTANSPFNESVADWTTAGGDNGSLINSGTVSAVGWFNLDIASTVGGWVANPDVNLGLLLKTDETLDPYLRFHSSDDTVSSRYPYLTINYIVPTEVTYYIRDAAGQVIATYKR